MITAMPRRLSSFVLIVALLIAVEPLLHNHPLQQKNIPDSCAICATGATPLPSRVPAVFAPQIVVETVTSAAVMTVTGGVSLTLVPRAPPA
jgi:hypothetical protein